MISEKIGDLLVEQGALDQKQLQEYLEASRKAGTTLMQYVAEQNLVAEPALLKAYARVLSATYLDSIHERMADTELLAQLPLKFLREHIIIPLRVDGIPTVVASRPQDIQAIDDVKMIIGDDAQLAFAPQATILDAINRYYPLEGPKEMIAELEEEAGFPDTVDFGAISEEDILAVASEAPIIKLVNHILYSAVTRDASDIHIEPFEKELEVRFRIDGVLYPTFKPPKRVQSALISRIKIMADLNIAEKRIPQDGRIMIKIADKAVDIRVSILPTTYGERVVMRLLDKTRTFKTLDKLGFSQRDYQIVYSATQQPNGIILVSGPTGSGKTSTLYSILGELNKPDVNIITVEDPVEYQMPGVGQVQVNEKAGLTFAVALRSILRQDPDIIMIGEMRDLLTSQIAIQASLTGHLVLSTIHTNSAPATITRLIDMGIEPFLISSTIVAVLAQRLVRKLHDACKKAYKPPKDLIARLGLTQAQADKITFYEPGGCDDCLQLGYKGRLAIFEVMAMTSGLSKLTVERADTNVLEAQAKEDGMSTLLQDGVKKIAAGLTSIEEVLTVATTTELVMQE